MGDGNAEAEEETRYRTESMVRKKAAPIQKGGTAFRKIATKPHTDRDDDRVGFTGFGPLSARRAGVLRSISRQGFRQRNRHCRTYFGLVGLVTAVSVVHR